MPQTELYSRAVMLLFVSRLLLCVAQLDTNASVSAVLGHGEETHGFIDQVVIILVPRS